MRLLTHNMLSSNIKGVINGFPLRIEAERVVEKQVDFNPDFLKNMFSKIDWKALADASKIMGYAELPDEVPDPSVLDSEEFLQKFHHALLELHLEEGALVCPETGRRFPVNKGIPNMLLHEDEIGEKICRRKYLRCGGLIGEAPLPNPALATDLPRSADLVALNFSLSTLNFSELLPLDVVFDSELLPLMISYLADLLPPTPIWRSAAREGLGGIRSTAGRTFSDQTTTSETEIKERDLLSDVELLPLMISSHADLTICSDVDMLRLWWRPDVCRQPFKSLTDKY